jgi:hypothetical protein
MKWPTLARLSPWAVRRKKRLEQYFETERHEFREAIDRHNKERGEKERQVDLLLHDRLEENNWLENRESKMSELMLHYQRTLIAAQIEIWKKLGAECPDLHSDIELAKL